MNVKDLVVLYYEKERKILDLARIIRAELNRYKNVRSSVTTTEGVLNQSEILHLEETSNIIIKDLYAKYKEYKNEFEELALTNYEIAVPIEEPVIIEGGVLNV